MDAAATVVDMAERTLRRESYRANCSARRRLGLGSAIVDFALVSGLLTLVFVAVVQLTIIVHVRNTCKVQTDDGWRSVAGFPPEWAPQLDRSPAH